MVESEKKEFLSEKVRTALKKLENERIEVIISESNSIKSEEKLESKDQFF